MDCLFEWNPRKKSANRQKHGVSFARAATLFNDPGAVTIFDDTHSGEEDRWVTLGIDRSGFCLW